MWFNEFMNSPVGQQITQILTEVRSQLSTVVAAAIISLLTMLYICFRNMNSRRFFKALIDDVSNIAAGNLENYNQNIKDLIRQQRHYIHHHLRVCRNGDQQTYMSFRAFLKRVKKENGQIYLIIGPSGIGKSTFMDHLASHLRKKFIKSKAVSLKDYGIFYVKFNGKPDFTEKKLYKSCVIC